MLPLNADDSAIPTQKMFRLVHDLSLKSGKTKPSLIGEDTEVDKTVIEHITDPRSISSEIVQITASNPLKNAGKSKSETGQIIIRAGHEAGEVVIQVSDDGQGLNRDKILAKAGNMGIIGSDGSQMSDDRGKSPDFRGRIFHCIGSYRCFQAGAWEWM